MSQAPLLTPLLKATNVHKSFRRGSETIPVLKGIDFELNEGEMVAITGASGAGKSTLLHVLGTLEKPDQGELHFGPTAQNILNFSERGLAEYRNRVLGFVFQFHYLLPEFTALENVMMPGIIGNKRQTKELETQAKELLEFVGLGHRMSHRPSELSGGEQQRVAIARAVILRPQVLLADEATGNLDTKNSEMILDLLVSLNRATRISVVLVTHDGGVAHKMHRTLRMRDGLFVS